jgi:hypothetical protein
MDLMDPSELEHGYRLEGYTRITTRSKDGCKILLYAHLSFQGNEWYDWVYVHFEEINAYGDVVENFYPARILGFITVNNVTEAVIHCAEKSLNWSEIEENFIVKTNLDLQLKYLLCQCRYLHWYIRYVHYQIMDQTVYLTLLYYQNGIGVVTLVIKSNFIITNMY